MRKISDRIKGSPYVSSLATLVGGTLLGTVFTAIYQVAQTWIYTPESIGVYTFLTTVPLMFIAVPSLRYDIAIVVEKDERKAMALVKLSAILALVTSLLVTLFYAGYIWFFCQEYRQYLYVLPFAFLIVFGYGINNLLNAYNNRCDDYGMISRKFVVRSAVQRLGMVAAGVIVVYLAKLESLSVLAMIVPYSLGLFVGIRNQASTLLARKEELRSVTAAEMKEAAKLHKNQPLFSAPALFVNSFSYSSITLIIEKLYDTTVIAYYSISNRVLGMPISLVSGNVAKVFIADAAKEYAQTGGFRRAFKKSFGFLLALAIPMFVGIYFLAPPVCGWLLGDGWEVAGEYIKIMGMMFAFRLVGTALSQVLTVCNKQIVELYVNFGLLAAAAISGLVAWYLQRDVLFFLQVLNVLRSACYAVLIVCVYCFSKRKKDMTEENENG